MTIVGSGKDCPHCGGWDGGGDSHECPGPIDGRIDTIESDITRPSKSARRAARLDR